MTPLDVLAWVGVAVAVVIAFALIVGLALAVLVIVVGFRAWRDGEEDTPVFEGRRGQ